MKKTARSLLISALILFCAGSILALSASLYAKINDVEIFEIENKEKKIESKTISIDEILAHSPNSNFVKKLSKTEFVQIDILSFSGDIKICSGAEKTELILDKTNTNNLKYEVVGGILKIEEVDPVGFCGLYIGEKGLSFKGLRHIFSSGSKLNTNSTITLKLKSDTKLDQLNINSYLGSVTLEDFDAEVFNIKAAIGNVNLKNLKNPDGKINITGNAANMNIKECNYSSCSINSRVGNISLDLLEQVGQSTVVDLWCGDIKIKTALPTSFYKFSVSTSLGNTKKNDESFGKKLSESGTTASRISSNIILGDFSIEYKGENESDYKPDLQNPTPDVTQVPLTTSISDIASTESTGISTT